MRSHKEYMVSSFTMWHERGEDAHENCLAIAETLL